VDDPRQKIWLSSTPKTQQYEQPDFTAAHHRCLHRSTIRRSREHAAGPVPGLDSGHVHRISPSKRAPPIRPALGRLLHLIYDGPDWRAAWTITTPESRLRSRGSSGAADAGVDGNRPSPSGTDRSPAPPIRLPSSRFHQKAWQSAGLVGWPRYGLVDRDGCSGGCERDLRGISLFGSSKTSPRQARSCG